MAIELSIPKAEAAMTVFSQLANKSFLDHQTHLTIAAWIYGISPRKGQTLQELMKTTVKLLRYYDVDAGVTKSPQKCLYFLAIADGWLASRSLADNKALANMFKIVCTGTDEMGQEISCSGRVKDLSMKGFNRWALYNPIAPCLHSGEELDQKRASYAKDFYDEARSVETELVCGWGKESLLSGIRRKLGINRKNEWPFELAVLSKTTKEMGVDIACSGFYRGGSDGAWGRLPVQDS